MKIDIPGYTELDLRYLLLDYNGTIAFDGKMADSVRRAIEILGEELQIYIVTSDTFGTVQSQAEGMKLKVEVLKGNDHSAAKRELAVRLGLSHTAAIGNGSNDALMLEAAALGIAIIGAEGASTKALESADIVVRDIDAALGLLTEPRRLIATLRR